MNLQRPHAGKQNARVFRVHHDVRTAAVFIGEQHALPRSPAVGRAKDTALLLWSVSMTKRARQNDVGIPGIDCEVADASGLLQSHQLPGLARVSRFVNSLPY